MTTMSNANLNASNPKLNTADLAAPDGSLLSSQPQPVSHSRSTWFMLIIAVCGWAVFCYVGLRSAIEIWAISEIFQHCFFVFPGAFYLIYQERTKLAHIALSPSWWALPFLCGQIAVYVLGLAGDIQVLMHIATFSMLPTLLWAVLGNRAAYHLIFPLCFMLFAIPIGEEMIPFLQEVTADISVYFLQLTGVPLYRSGLFIEIPEGRFLVAEACSGISFFIASVVIGNLYAYMNLRSTKRRILFVLLAVVYPILANAIRVYGIILTGHLTDMEHAVGADHLIYGWFFFSLVIISLILIGEVFRRGDKPTNHLDSRVPNMAPPLFVSTVNKRPFYSVLGLLLAGGLWGLSVLDKTPDPKAVFTVNFANSDVLHRSLTPTVWQPQFADSASQELVSLQRRGVAYEVFQVSYDGAQGELVGFHNKLFSQARWTLESVFSPGLDWPVKAQQITSVNSEKRFVYFAYWFAGEFYTSKTRVKLAQTFANLLNQSGAMRMVAVSFTATTNTEQIEQYEEIVAAVLAEFSSGVADIALTKHEVLEQRRP